MTQSIKTLIERLEKASGPDRELDWQIAGIIYPWLAGRKWEPWTESEHDKIGARWFKDEENKWYPFAFELFTASIDSALTLVPEGWRWRVERYNTDETKCHAELAQVGQIRDFGIGIKCRAQAHAKTPAIALCIAALKSREAQT